MRKTARMKWKHCFYTKKKKKEEQPITLFPLHHLLKSPHRKTSHFRQFSNQTPPFHGKAKLVDLARLRRR